MFNHVTNSFAGMRVFEVEGMKHVIGEDWSEVRSPARARRRRKKHPQRIKPIYAPDENVIVDKVNHAIYCHPIIAQKLRAKLRERP